MIKKITVLVLCISLIFGILVCPCYAQEDEFAYLDKSCDMAITVQWEKGKPTVKFKSPDGTIYNPESKAQNTITALGSNSLYYIIKNAPSGQWYIDITKADDAKVQVTWSEYHSAIYIDSFTVDNVNNNIIPVTFKVLSENGDEIYYRYKISAVVSKAGSEKVLTENSASTDREVTLNVPLNNLSSGDGFMIKLYVWYSIDGVDIFDTAFSEPFNYVNPNLNDSFNDFMCTIEPENFLAYVKLPNDIRSADDFLVAIFEDENDEPSYYYTYAPDADVELSYSPEAKKVKIAVSPGYSGTYGSSVIKTFDPANFRLSVDCKESTNDPLLMITYNDMPQNTIAQVSVNGSQDSGVVLSQSGTLSLKLEDGNNNISVTYTENGISWRLTRNIYLNRTFPEIVFGESYDGMVTGKEKFTFVGSVKDALSVTVNGESLPLNSGTFKYIAPLTPGENIFEFVAINAAGGETKSTVVITRSDVPIDKTSQNNKIDSPLARLIDNGSILWICLSSFIGILIAVYAALFWKKAKKQNDNKKDSTEETKQ